MGISDFFAPLFDPLLELGVFWALLIVSIVLSVAITFIYKFMTNQEEMKDLKEKTKFYQKEMKKEKANPKKMMKLQKEAMSINGKYMMKSMRPTLVTFLPVIIIFGWLSANLAFYPIDAGDDFSIEMTFKNSDGKIADMVVVGEGIEIVGESEQTISDNLAKWQLRAKEQGMYTMQINFDGEEYSQKVKIASEIGDYLNPEQRIQGGNVKVIETIHEQIRPLDPFTLFGWRPNWLWTYIIFSMIISISLRKALKLY